PNEEINLGESIVLSMFDGGTYGPRPFVPVEEIVRLTKSQSTPSERAAKARAEQERQEQESAKRRQQEEEESREMAEWLRREAEKDEAERMRNPNYAVRKLADRVARLESQQ